MMIYAKNKKELSLFESLVLCIYVFSFDGQQNSSGEDQEDINTSDNKSNQQGVRQYKHLIAIHGGKSKGSMKNRLKDDVKVRRLSLSEKKLKSASESHGADLIRYLSNSFEHCQFELKIWSAFLQLTTPMTHDVMLSRFTQRNILRVFPKGERVKSTNFRPYIGWLYGVQMVAFNMQVGMLRQIHKAKCFR